MHCFFRLLTAKIYKALSSPLRLKILSELSNNALSANDIIERVGTSKCNIYSHLTILEDQGLVIKKGTYNHIYTQSELALNYLPRSF